MTQSHVWFVEVPRMGGGWTPQLHHGDRPSSKGAEGASKRFRSEPVEVSPEHLGLSLTELQEIYGADRPVPAEPDISPRYIDELETRAHTMAHIIRRIFYLHPEDGPMLGILPDEPLHGLLAEEELELIRDIKETPPDRAG